MMVEQFLVNSLSGLIFFTHLVRVLKQKLFVCLSHFMVDGCALLFNCLNFIAQLVSDLWLDGNFYRILATTFPQLIF